MSDDPSLSLSALSARLTKLDAETASAVRGIMDIIRLRESRIAIAMARLEARIDKIGPNHINQEQGQ